jgi:hypothetical protein
MIEPPPLFRIAPTAYFGAEEHALGVHRHDAVPLGFAGLHVRLGAFDPGVVEQHVEAPVPGDRELDHLSRLRVPTDVRAHERGFPALGLDLCGDSLALLDLHVGDHHLRAFAREELGRRFPDAGGAAGDERNLSS